MEADYIQILKQRITRQGIDHLKSVADKVDENFCARYYGLPTWHFRNQLGYPTSTHRNALKKLEKEGKVIAYKQCENQLHWWPVGFLEEIKTL